MKIIKDGKDFRTEIVNNYKLVCDNCDCEFEFTRADAESLSKTINGGGTVRCPYCGKILGFSKANEIGTSEEKIKIQKFTKIDLQLQPTVEPYTYLSPYKKNHCTDCPNNPANSSNPLTIGDSPCQWCQYGTRPTCITNVNLQKAHNNLLDKYDSEL